MKNKKQYIFLVSFAFMFILAFFSIARAVAAEESFDVDIYTSKEPVPGAPNIYEQYGNPVTKGDPNFLQELIESGCEYGFEKIGGVCIPTQENTGLSEQGILDILANFLGWMFALFSILAVGAFIVSGIQYLVSAGDSGLAETAKKNAKWALIGIIVGLSGFLILQAVSSALSGNSIF